VLEINIKRVSTSVFPIKKRIVTLLKSPHVYKKSKEQYQIKKYRVVIVSPACSCNRNLFKFFLLNKPKSVVLSFVLER
jgi:ribosomal protein S10